MGRRGFHSRRKTWWVGALVLLAACSDPSELDSRGIPRWVPSYPGAEERLLHSAEREGVLSGTLTGSTTDGRREVLAYYRSALEEAGLVLETTPLAGPEGTLAVLTGHAPDEARGVTVTIAPGEDGTTVLLNFSQRM